MNRQRVSFIAAALVLGAWSLVMAQPVGTSFTYQGRLKQSGLPANAPVDLQFALYDAATGGTSVTPQPICRDNVPVVDGLFTCSLDFGPVFTGTERYLQIGVRPAGAANDCGTGSYTPLSARQQITTTPYAQWANLGPGAGGSQCCDPRVDVSTLPASSNALHEISQPGSYILSANITGISGKNGIRITASSVTLDLNGFSLIGVGGALNGVDATGTNVREITIRNGSIQSWGQNGILATAVEACRFEDLHVHANISFGLAGGSWNEVRRCTTTDNGQSGISVDDGCDVFACTSSGNGAIGIRVGLGCTLAQCKAISNQQHGFLLTSSCTMRDCSSVLNTQNGINCSNGCALNNCIASSNDMNGILVGAGCELKNCCGKTNIGNGIQAGTDAAISSSNAYDNGGIGILTGSGATISYSTASLNDGSGIDVGSDCALTNCSARGNGDKGIIGDFSVTLSACNASDNGAHGISIQDGSTVTNCSASFNSGSGVLTFESCTVKGCTAMSNVLGGISAVGNVTISDCNASNNGSGIVAGYSSTVINCATAGNSLGINADSGTTVRQCTARNNQGNGINATDAEIAECSTYFNGGSGIASSGGRIASNNCSDNGAGNNNTAGILSTGSGARIESNLCARNRNGIWVGGDVFDIDNVIDGNSCVGNSFYNMKVDTHFNIITRNNCHDSGTFVDWGFTINNYYGPIIDRRGDSTSGVNGYSASGTLNTSDPFANFSH